MIKTTVLLSLLITSIQSSFSIEKVIYGADNREDVYSSTNNLYKELAASTAAMIHEDFFSKVGSETSRLLGAPWTFNSICPSERFSHQMIASTCSGFLVGEDLLATAGHCIEKQKDCAEQKWAFDYEVENETQFPIHVLRSNVYGCKKIIGRSLKPVNGSMDDWALIRLDRKVTDRRVLDIRVEGQPAIGENLVMIGHPAGLPKKITDGAKVTRLELNFFRADLDAYGGNSGSAVFNSKTGVVEGILVRGNTDYIKVELDDGKKCKISNKMPNNFIRSESVSNISRLSKLILDNR